MKVGNTQARQVEADDAYRLGWPSFALNLFFLAY
jgi:hypothetical protein